MSDTAISPIREQAIIERGLAMDATTLAGLTSVFSNGTAFQLACKMADMLAHSSLMPDAYKGNPSNCLIAIDYAARLGLSPVMLAQNMDVVKGKPGLQGKLLIALINASPLFSRLRWDWKGTEGADDYGCRAWAVDKETGERLDGAWITWAMVKAEGWASNAKWKNMPEQMFPYRAASFWSRQHAPDVTLGLYEADELLDMHGHPAPSRTAPPVRAEILDLQQRLMDRTRLTMTAVDAEVKSEEPPAAEPAPASEAPNAPAAGYVCSECMERSEADEHCTHCGAER